jgi:hypothetical protein
LCLQLLLLDGELDVIVVALDGLFAGLDLPLGEADVRHAHAILVEPAQHHLSAASAVRGKRGATRTRTPSSGGAHGQRRYLVTTSSNFL